MNKLRTLLVIVALTLAAGSALAQDGDKTVVFAVDPTWPPLEFTDSSGQTIGYSVDYFTAVCRESGREANFIKADWDTIFSDLDAGKFDAVMSSVTVTPERRQKMDFTIPYFIVRQSLVVARNSDLTSIHQLKDKRVGTQEATTATEIVEKIPGVISKTFPTIEDSLKAVIAGEADAVICEEVVATNFLSQPDFSGKIKMATVINTPGAEELYAVAVRKNNLPVLVMLNDGIKAVKAKGIEAELRRKWFPDSGK